MLRASLLAIVLSAGAVWFGGDASAGQEPCIGITCGLDNKCMPTKSASSRNCCCSPVCSPEPVGCVSCLQNCWVACSIHCNTLVCPTCAPAGGGGGGVAGADKVFHVRPGQIEAAWKEHLVAGIVIQGRSQGGKTAMFSEMVRGGTSLYGYQVGFDVDITAGPQLLRLDIVFDDERTLGTLPENVRFEIDTVTGRMRTTEIPADALDAIRRRLAARDVPCEVVLALAGSLRY